MRPGALARRAILALALLAAACSPMKVEEFAGTGPAFDPARFFAGRTSSWGVIEGRGGEPLRSLRTSTEGTLQGSVLELDQTLSFDDGETRPRHWQLTRLSEHAYEATATDILGKAVGEVRGRALRMTYELMLSPPNRWKTVHAVHWMYLADDGVTMLNRVTFSKFGVVVAHVSESFRHQAD